MEKKTVNVKVKNVTESPRKLRLVVDLVRNHDVDHALNVLKFLNKKGAKIVEKAIVSGAANANQVLAVGKGRLYISKIWVDEGRKQKKVEFASRARVNTLVKRNSHLNVELSIK